MPRFTANDRERLRERFIAETEVEANLTDWQQDTLIRVTFDEIDEEERRLEQAEAQVLLSKANLAALKQKLQNFYRLYQESPYQLERKRAVSNRAYLREMQKAELVHSTLLEPMKEKQNV